MSDKNFLPLPYGKNGYEEINRELSINVKFNTLQNDPHDFRANAQLL